MNRNRAFAGIVAEQIGSPVIALAVGGYDLSQYRVLLENFYEDVSATAIVLCIFANGLKPYFDKDLHWNEAGHRLAADVIEEKLFTPSSTERLAH